jgi:DNA-binding PadR family transcriptional regulator
MQNPGELEELVMLTILGLGNETYGVPLREALEAAGRKLNAGALFVTVERLEGKGFVETWAGEATPERGGKAKKYYRVTGLGQQALSEVEARRRAVRGSWNPIGGMA